MREMFEAAYWDVQRVLDEKLGPLEQDGAGEGVAADVALLAEQRDEARAERDAARPVVEAARAYINWDGPPLDAVAVEAQLLAALDAYEKAMNPDA